MSECISCNGTEAQIQWRNESWCVDCFKNEANSREASSDWVRRVLGITAKPTFELPLDATAVDYSSRVELLTEQTVLNKDLAKTYALDERGFSPSEIADRLDIDPAEVEAQSQRIEEKIELARKTVQILD